LLTDLFRYVDTGEMLDNFPYRARAMFAFQEQEGADVCFFGMHVQVNISSTN
jgi:E1A/CREB-binding protein